MIRSFIRHMAAQRHHRDSNERGAAIVETALTLPVLLLVAVGIFEFGHAFQTWQVLTNSAREGARLAVIAGNTDGTVTTRVRDYLTAGGVSTPMSAGVVINRNETITGTAGRATSVTVTYPHQFMAIGPVVGLVTESELPGSVSLRARATMRNE